MYAREPSAELQSKSKLHVSRELQNDTSHLICAQKVKFSLKNQWFLNVLSNGVVAMDAKNEKASFSGMFLPF
jgi:hypothetical protein